MSFSSFCVFCLGQSYGLIWIFYALGHGKFYVCKNTINPPWTLGFSLFCCPYPHGKVCFDGMETPCFFPTFWWFCVNYIFDFVSWLSTIWKKGEQKKRIINNFFMNVMFIWFFLMKYSFSPLKVWRNSCLCKELYGHCFEFWRYCSSAERQIKISLLSWLIKIF